MEYCLDCRMELRGRTDKKFCDDHCRGHYNNNLNRDRYAIFKDINSILRRNEAILEKFKKKGIAKLTADVLSAAGFNFNFFTHQVRCEDGTVCHYCYQHGYRHINRKELALLGIPVPGKIKG